MNPEISEWCLVPKRDGDACTELRITMLRCTNDAEFTWNFVIFVFAVPLGFEFGRFGLVILRGAFRARAIRSIR